MKRLDFSKYCLIIVSLVLAMCSFSFEALGQGSVTNVTFYSKSLKMNRAVQIYLPEGYNKQNPTRYPVIYWLHGAGGNSTTNPEIFGVLNDLIGGDTISPVIIVKPDGSTNKNPWDGDSWYTNSELYGNFEDYIVFDLVKFIDSAYNVISSREKRAIMGHSMGALGAMRFALKHPDVYRGVASHSGFPDMTKLSQYWPIILSENGGAPVSSYNPSAGEMTRIVGFACSGAYSPNVNNPPYFVDFPLDSMGNLIDSVWNRWLLHNCALLARNINQESDLAIYFDCGVQDETLAYPFNTGFADTLDKLGLPYEFQSFTGGHYVPNRYPIGFKFLDSVMNTTVGISEEVTIQPKIFYLYQNYPNPFNPTTNIGFRIANFEFVSLKIYDVLGNEVAVLVNEEKPNGNYKVEFDGSNLSSGIYFYTLKAGQFVSTKKLLLLK